MTHPNDHHTEPSPLPHNHRRARRPEGTGRIRRSRDNRVLAGVIGGMAEFLDISARWPRLLFLLSIPLSGGITLLVYLILWLLLPGPVHEAGKNQ